MLICFRMRGIGKGQTITLITPPEVSRLIQADLSEGRGIPFGEQQAIQPGNDERDLCNVSSWLILNGMRSERTQANMLLCQNTGNVWKKRAYRDLLSIDASAVINGRDKSERFSTALLAWKEDTDSTVPNRIPESGSLEQSIRERVNGLKRLGVITIKEDIDEIERILTIEIGQDEISGGTEQDSTVLLEGEQVQEQEQEQVLATIDHFFACFVFLIALPK
jgi:hypothetical protein